MPILLVEDDRGLAQGLKRALQNEGFAVNHVENGKTALASIATERPELVILDIGLPDIDGIEVLQSIRRTVTDLPVLLLTARASLEDKVRGLDKGADDYLPKPFEMPELLARIRALQRRRTGANTEIAIGAVRLDTASLTVSLDSQAVELSRREYMLLKALMEKAGRVQTRDALETCLYSWGEEVASNTIEVHIHNLRKKLGGELIRTVRGVGYVIGKA